ncbi:hypothetical protein Godav_010229 [Gossypium davidsonii]|uniref:Uncharacterized protein n=2 Tax=Gossypium TaxID=3633 RepID=A0A7J8SFV7_GOSDV|nr:hypothetical protein [Gossypium davidsonii]MBA0660505.1 hypothetical protein [Gossypium klotzschianum]
MLKLGVEPTVVTFSTLINGPCIQNKVSEAVSMLDEMTTRLLNEMVDINISLVLSHIPY